MRHLKIIFQLIIGTSIFLSNVFAQTEVIVPPSNRSVNGLEKNLLFYANQRLAVSQQGPASMSLDKLFDGNFNVQYSNGVPTPTQPFVLTIENLPNIHVQAGAWVGWTTRYYNPVKFKIEVFNGYNWGSPGYPAYNEWMTVADVDGYGGGSYIIPISLVSATKIRYTIYAGSGPNGMFGLSELFFIHPEAASAYDHLMVKYANNGSVGIGTDVPGTDKLAVNGTIRSKEVKVEAVNWPDYVFSEDYQPLSLPDLAVFIKNNGHLPDIPSASQVEVDGIKLSEMNNKLLKKVEELTLYLLDMNNQNIKRDELIKKQQEQINQLLKSK